MKTGCKEITSISNDIRQYVKSASIDTSETNAVAFVNMGTSIASINGFPLAAGQSLSFGTSDRCQMDCTKYQLAFVNNGSQTNSLFVFRGHSAINFSQVNAASGGGAATNVNIHDSSGNVLNSDGAGNLDVVDAALATILTSFENANHTDLSAINTNLLIIKQELLLLAGQGGCKVCTAPYSGTSLSVQSLQIISAATFTIFKVAGADQRSAYGLDASSIAAPAYIASLKGNLITDISITVGQIIIYY